MGDVTSCGAVATPVHIDSWKEPLSHGLSRHLGGSPGAAKEKGENQINLPAPDWVALAIKE